MTGMKIVFQLFVFISLILFIQVCQDVPREQGARLVFEEENYDFGEIEQGVVLTHVFNFENIGEDTLKISRVLSSWGCTASLLSSEVIAPGETGELSVTFKSKKRKGKNKKSIRIYSNDHISKVKKITITAFVTSIKESWTYLKGCLITRWFIY